MDHLKILRRALDITRRYRALWLFGAVIAVLSSGGGGGGGARGQGFQYELNGEDFLRFRRSYPFPYISPQTVRTLIGVGIGLACLALILLIISIIARYVAETSLIRMVDHHETTGEKLGIRDGIRLGWSRTAFRLFLMDLAVNVPIAVAFFLLLLLTLSPLLLWATGNRAAGIVGTVATVGLVVLVVLAAILVSIVSSLLIRFFRRVCVLEERGVVDAIRQGLAFSRRHISDIVIMALLMFGLGIVYAMVIIPVGILLALVAGAVAAVPGLLAGWLTSLFSSGAAPWIVGVALGVPIFIVALAVPLLFVGGLAEVYQSTVWTLTYRELRALEERQTQPA